MSPKLPIFLDYSATTPMAPEVILSITEALQLFGNPSSLNYFGSRIRDHIEIARGHVGTLLGCDPSNIFFCSGATEGNNLILKSLRSAMSRFEKPHLITSSIEHKSVLNVFEDFAKHGGDVDYLGPDQNGRLSLDQLQSMIRESTRLCSIMSVNNELGTVQPISDFAKHLDQRNIAFHTDATQALGKIPFDVTTLGVDFATFSSHKIYGPTGVGGFYIKNPKKFDNDFIKGGNQESRQRPGTENFLGIIGFGEACRLATVCLNNDITRSVKLKSDIKFLLKKELGARICINADIPESIPTCLSFTVSGLDARDFLKKSGHKYVLGTGSACNSESSGPSHVLSAIGLTSSQSQSTLRLSFGRYLDNITLIQTVKGLARDLVDEI